MVDDLEEARKLCYGSDRHKVVSVDGTMFKPNGTFTGLYRWPAAIVSSSLCVCMQLRQNQTAMAVKMSHTCIMPILCTAIHNTR